MSIFLRICIFLGAFLSFNTAFSAEQSNNAKASIVPTKILVILTNHAQYPHRADSTGLWLTELTHFIDIIDTAGFELDFVSPKGGKVPLDERSLRWLYMDRAAKAYLNDPEFIYLLNHTRQPEDINPLEYKAIYFTGGHGTMWDFRNNVTLKNIAEEIYNHGGIISSVCHGAAGLLNLQDLNGKALIADRHVTGFSNTEEKLSGIEEQVPFFLQNELISQGANYKKALLPFQSFVVVDNRFITGQNPNSSKAVARELIKLIQRNNQ